MSTYEIKQIAHVESDFNTKFGVPRQAGLVEELEAEVVFEPEFRNPESLRGIDSFSHIWLIWQFSENLREDWSPTVRPPRLGGNARLGVFATRSPFRPNAIGLSCVKLSGIRHDEKKGDVLVVRGADLVNGTPVFDIKPYIPYADCRPDASEGFAPMPEEGLNVLFEPGTEEKIPEGKITALKKVLACDPRPRYQNDETRIYGMDFAGMNIKFTVSGNVLTVKEIIIL